jgi:hypothetical protein
MGYIFTCFLLMISVTTSAQRLELKKRSRKAVSGSAFAMSIIDSALSLDARENIIYNEIKSGNVPHFYRKLSAITDTIAEGSHIHTVKYYVLPDFFAVGSDEDYFYCPMRPQLAQKVADLLKCNLPTRKISDRIYKYAKVKMVPEPIPPSPKMVTLPVFIKHNYLVQAQRAGFLIEYPLGTPVAGNKKDVVISNKIYSDEKSRVVIYGWHKPDGKAIQPLYNGHTSLHVDYSHGIRLVQDKMWVDGKKSSAKKVMQSTELHQLLSDEGIIDKPYYPVN